jgi:hypothetical protein
MPLDSLNAFLAGAAGQPLPSAAPSAPSAANPTGWMPPAGVPTETVPVVNVGSGPDAETPGAQFATVPTAPPPAPGQIGAGSAGTGAAIPTPSAAPSPSPGISPLAAAVVNQLRAERGLPISVGGQTVTGAAAQTLAAFQRGAVDPDAAPAAPPGAPTVGPGQRTGYIANIGAGTSAGVAQLLGMPVQLANTAANLPIEGVNAVFGTHIPTFDPNAGTRAVESAEGLVGADPRDVVAATPGQKLVRTAAEGATGMVLPGGIAAGLPEAAGVAGAARDMLASGAGPSGAAVGAGGAVAGQAAANAVPAPYKAAANLAGNLLGGGAVAGGEALAAGAGRLGMGAVRGIAAAAGQGAHVPLVDPVTGEAVLDENGQPVTAAPQQMAAAGRGLAAKAGMTPAQLAGAIPGAEASPVAGFTPTVGPSMGNVGMLRAERALRMRYGELFTASDQMNNAALRRAIGALSPGDAGMAAGRFVRALFDAQNLADEARIEAAQAGAGAEMDAMRGDPRTTSVQAEGATARPKLEALAKPLHDTASHLQQLVDPEGTLGVNGDAVGQTARTLRGDPVRDPDPDARAFGVDPTAGDQMTAQERAVIDAAAKVSGVAPFERLRRLLSNIETAKRAIAKSTELGTRSRNYTRMSILARSVQDAMADGVAEAVTHEEEAASAREGVAGQPSASPGAQPTTIAGRLAQAAVRGLAPGAEDKVYLPSGRVLDVEYRVLDGKHLVVSHDQEMRPNPAFPPELQPRDRSSTASRLQVQRMAAHLQPERLGRSPGLSEGAPLVGPDGVVESGNGRTLAIMRANAEAGEQSAAYREWLHQEGYDTTGIDNPVLVRVRKTPLSGPERVQVAREGNVSPAMAMSASERALSDAKRMPDGVLELWRGGDVRAAANRPFVNAFARTVPETGEEGGLLTAEGGLSLDGERRIESALLARGYGDKRLVEALADAGDESIGALGKGMMDAAGAMAQVRAAVARGDLPADADLAPTLLDAARVVSRARLAKLPLADIAHQQDMLSGGVAHDTLSLLHEFYGPDLAGKGSRVKIANFLAEYSRLAQNDIGATSLFGEPPSRDELIEGARRAASKNSGPRSAPRAGGFGAPDRPDAAKPGGQIGEPGPSAPGPGAGTAVEGSAAGEPEPEPVTALRLDPEAAGRLRTANAAWADYLAKARKGPVGEVLAGAPRAYRLSDAQVMGKLFRSGPAGADTADALIRIAGSVEKAQDVLGDYPALALRRAAEKNGILDPAKAARWMQSHSAILDKFPALRAKFQTAADASQAVGDAMARARMNAKAFNDSELAHFLGTDPQVAIERLLGGDDPAGDAQSLMDTMRATALAPRRGLTAVDGARAIEGLRQNTVEWLMAKAEATAKAGTSGEAEIAKGRFQNLLKNPKTARALRVILGPDGFKGLEDVSRAMDLAAMVRDATAVKGSPGTAADLMAAARGRGMSPLVRLFTGEFMGEAVSHIVGGLAGAAGHLGSVAFAMLRSAAKEAGFDTVQQLMAYGIIHPEIGRLLAQVAAGSERTPAFQTLMRRLGALSVGAAAQGQPTTSKGGP